MSEPEWSFGTTPDYLIVPDNQVVQTRVADLIRREITHNPDQITTLRGFCTGFIQRNALEMRVMSDGQALHILAEVLENIRTEVPFFFHQSNPAPTTLKDLLALRDILSQRRTTSLFVSIQNQSEKFRQIGRALQAYETTLSEKNLLDATSLIDWTIAKIRDDTEIRFGTIIVSGLHHPLPREQELISIIRDRASRFRYEYHTGKDTQIFSTVDWIKPEELTPLPISDENLRISSLFMQCPESLEEKKILQGSFRNPKEEFEAVAEEISTLNDEGHPLEGITIAVPDLSSSQTLITDVLRDFGIPCHVFTGEPLTREPIIGFLMSIPELVLHTYPRQDLISLISSPYFYLNQPGLPPASPALIDRITRAAMIEEGFCWDLNFQNLTESLQKEDKSPAPIPLESIQTVRTIINEIQSDLNQFMNPGTQEEFALRFQMILQRWMIAERTDREIRVMHRFNSLLTRLVMLSHPDQKISLHSFYRSLTYLLEELINLEEDRGGVRVVGFQRKFIQPTQVLFLSGLIEGDIPHPSTRLPLVNSTESEQLGSRSLEDVIREEQFYFLNALMQGERIYLSSPQTRKERLLLTSSFLERVIKVWNPADWRVQITHSQSHAAVRAGKLLSHPVEPESGIIPDEVLAWLPSGINALSIANRILIEDWHRTGSPDSPYDGVITSDIEISTWIAEERFPSDRIWSPTQLEMYATCPFRFFLERVIRLTPLKEVDLTLSSADKGTLIHQTLCDFFSEWCREESRQITPKNLETALSLLKKYATDNSEKFRFHSPAWYATIQVLIGDGEVPGLLDRFVQKEADRENSSLTPFAFELDIKTEPSREGDGDSVPYVTLDHGEGEPVRIQGRIDRVDCSRDGFFAIIDYKTGITYPKAKDIAEGSALQLPLYILALEKMYQETNIPMTGIAGSYCEISRKIKQTWPLLSQDHKSLVTTRKVKATADFRMVLQGSLDAARRHICGIRAGSFPLTQDACTILNYCEYRNICRYDRFRVSEQEEEGEE